jgi:hypothetical protein
MNNIQATGEAFSSQNRTFSASKHKISSLFYIFGSFLASGIRTHIPMLDPDSADQNQCGSIRTRIHISDITAKRFEIINAGQLL